MELHKLKVLERQTSTRNHGETVTRAGMGARGTEVRFTETTRSKHGAVSAEAMDRAVLEVEGSDTDTLAILHNQIKRKELDEVRGVVAQRLAVKRMKHGVACAVGSGGTAVRLSTLAIMERLATECTLVDLAFLRTRKGQAVVLQLQHRVRRLTAHIVDGVLVTQPVRALDGVVHVPAPVILRHVTEGGIDTALRSHSMRTSGEKLGDTSGVKTTLSETESGTQTCTTGTHNNRIVFVLDHRVALREIRHTGRTRHGLGTQRLRSDHTRCLCRGMERVRMHRDWHGMSTRHRCAHHTAQQCIASNHLCRCPQE